MLYGSVLSRTICSDVAQLIPQVQHASLLYPGGPVGLMFVWPSHGFPKNMNAHETNKRLSRLSCWVRGWTRKGWCSLSTRVICESHYCFLSLYFPYLSVLSRCGQKQVYFSLKEMHEYNWQLSWAGLWMGTIKKIIWLIFPWFFIFIFSKQKHIMETK